MPFFDMHANYLPRLWDSIGFRRGRYRWSVFKRLQEKLCGEFAARLPKGNFNDLSLRWFEIGLTA